MSSVPVLDATAKIEELVKYIQEDLEGSLGRSEERLREIQRLLDQCTEMHTVGTLWAELVFDASSGLRAILSKAFHSRGANTAVNPAGPTPEMIAPVPKKRQRDAVALSEPPAKKQNAPRAQLERVGNTQCGSLYTMAGPPLTKKQQASNWILEGRNLGYTMSRDSKMTVRDLWNEYQLGSEESVKPVKWLDWYFGTCWRAEETPRQYYHRRQVIYREVEQMVQHRLERQLAEGKILQQGLLEGSKVRSETEARAVEWLDQWPRGPYSVHQMGQQIKRARKMNPNGELPAFEAKREGGNQPQAPSPWYSEDSQPLATKFEGSLALSQSPLQVQETQSLSSLMEGPSPPAVLVPSHSTTAPLQNMIGLLEACVHSGFPESNIRGSGTIPTKNTGRPWEL